MILLCFFLREEWKNAKLASDAEWTIGGQVMTQLIGLGSTILLAAVGTLAICFVIEKTIGFRLPDSKEKAGLDHALHGESGYGLLNLN